jgi:hypothetical protein
MKEDVAYLSKSARFNSLPTSMINSKLVLNFRERVAFELSDVDAHSKLILIYYNNAMNSRHLTVR